MREIIENNKNWILSRTDGNLIIQSHSISKSSSILSLCFFQGIISKEKRDTFTIYSWEERRKEHDCLVYENGHSKKFLYKKLIINCTNNCLLYAEKDASISDRRNGIYRITLYDCNLSKVDSFLGVFYDDVVEPKRLCSITDILYYHIFAFDGKERIIINEGHKVKILTISPKGMNGNPLVFDCVDELYRVTRAEGHTIYMYSFFVLKTKNYSIVFNIRTLKYIEVSYENIIPTNFTFRKKDYTTIFETTIIRHSPEYLCVDNSIFDENLTELAKISTRWDAKPILLDICDCFIAVTDFRGVINIFKWTPYNKTKVEECLYYFKSSENTNDVSLVVEDEFSNNIMSFDPIKKRFVVKAECIDKKLDIKTIDYDESNDYSIMDALDGDPEAYGNID